MLGGCQSRIVAILSSRPHSLRPVGANVVAAQEQLLDRAAVASGDPLFGAKLGMSFDPMRYVLMSYIGFNSKTLADAALKYARYQALIASKPYDEVEQSRHAWTIRFRWIMTETVPGTPVMMMTTMMAWMILMTTAP